MKQQKIIIDFEFNGLPRYNFTPEITQVKMKNLTNGKSVCKNFKTHRKGVCREFYGILEGGTSFFNKKEFEKLLSLIGGHSNDQFYGFSIKTDKLLLEQSNINLDFYQDIQEELMRLQKFERRMALGGRSLECCYFIATNKVVTVDHNNEDELVLIEALYNASKNGRKRRYLTIFPYGENAGEPLQKYIIDNRRRADGYRYNNNDILAKSLDYYIDQAESSWSFDDEFTDDDDDDNIISSDETVEEQKYEGPARSLEEIKNLLPRSSRNRVSRLALERALEEGVITAEEAEIVSEAMICF